MSAFKIKNTNRPDVFDFYFRICADGSRQIKGLHFEESHSPVPCTWTILTSICVAAAFGLTGYIIDVDNAFQNTPRYPDENTKPLFITCPPLYLPWFKQRFPNFIIDPTVRLYVLQYFMNMRTAGRDFHTLLTAVLEKLHIREFLYLFINLHWNFWLFLQTIFFSLLNIQKFMTEYKTNFNRPLVQPHKQDQFYRI